MTVFVEFTSSANQKVFIDVAADIAVLQNQDETTWVHNTANGLAIEIKESVRDAMNKICNAKRRLRLMQRSPIPGIYQSIQPQIKIKKVKR